MLPRKYEADAQLKYVIEKSAQAGHRAILFIYSSANDQTDNYTQEIGEQVMVIHYLLSKLSHERPSILWCHKYNSLTPRVSKKVLKNLERRVKSGNCDIPSENALHLFFLSTKVKFCPFAESHSVLGHTYNMCVIQDFDGLTPNILCRVTETVCSGGAIIFLLPGLSSLRDLFSLPMDIHQKLKTYSHSAVSPLFNERFVLSLASCRACLVLDNNFKLRQEIANQKSIKNVCDKNVDDDSEENSLEDLMESLSDAEKPLPQLCKLCCTVDQAKAVLKMIDVLTEKTGHSTVSLSAGRGRGKSAALGLSVAAAIYFGVNNIFVVSPSPENLCTFFEFLFKGFDALSYEEKQHYEIIQSTNPEFKEAIVRVNIFARHRQNIQYVSPSDSKKVSQAELVVIDEAAAIPLVHVKSLLGPHNVFMASTINGYEGTGRSLSLKLLQQLRQQSVPAGATAVSASEEQAVHLNCRPLFELTLEKSIRYKPNDPVEKWLNDLLCLEATSNIPTVTSCPPPYACNLYYVNREVLFSGHKATETFLQQVTSLLVASHYRNSPDDLQILSDAPSHHLFVLLSHLPSSGSSTLPMVYSVLQVCEEGGIPHTVSEPVLIRGQKPTGDLIPWTVATQFCDHSLTELKGIRIVRIATHPDYQGMGYGSRAVTLLTDYFRRRFMSLDDVSSEPTEIDIEMEDNSIGGLIAPRHLEKPLLLNLRERHPEAIDFIGVSYGLTEPLYKFWMKSQFTPVYISLVPNKITAEYNCIMLHALSDDPSNQDDSTRPAWMNELAVEFTHRFTSLLGAQFNNLHPKLVLKILTSHTEHCEENEIGWTTLESIVSGHDLKRLESYAKNLSDRHLITDLVPTLATLYFTRRLHAVHLSPLQAGLLVGCGYQFKSVETVAKELNLPIESALGQFNRAIRRLHNAMCEIQERAVSRSLPESVMKGFEIFKPVTISLEEDLAQTAQEFEVKNKQLERKGRLGVLDCFAIKGDDETWDKALQTSAAESNNTISIKSLKRPERLTEKDLAKELGPEPALKKKKSKGKFFKGKKYKK